MPSIQQVGPGWFKELEPVFSTDWFARLRTVVSHANTNGTICPEAKNIFRALRECQPENVKVVIIGQDPYPSNHADGLAFSSQQSTMPESLKIIYEDLQRVYGAKPQTSDLTGWAKQGVLLLNTSLSVVRGVPMSHSDIGWEHFIRAVFSVLSKQKHIVYFAWGKPAQLVVANNVQPAGNLILESYHPIAQSYSRGRLKFDGRFEEANNYLVLHRKEPIQWII